MSKVQDIAIQIRGVSYKPNDLHDSLDENSVILLRANNIADDKLDFEDVVYVDKSKVSDSQYLQTGDILVCASSGSKNLVGKATIIRENINATFGAFCKVVRPKNILPQFLGHYFTSPKYRDTISQLSAGANINNIRNEHIDSLELCIPDSETQRQIATTLDKVTHLIDLCKQQLETLDLLVKSRFVEMFGDPITNPLNWKKEKTEHHIDLLSGYPFKSEQYVDSGINICGGLIIMPQRIEWDSCVHWASSDGYEEYLLADGDIVMALDRPWITEGFKIALVDDEHLPALLIQRTARIRAMDINQKYLYYCFINGGFDKHTNITGSLVPHISAKDIRSFEIMIPPLELQNQFAAFVEQTNKSKLAVQKQLETLETLKKSLMQEYFG